MEEAKEAKELSELAIVLLIVAVVVVIGATAMIILGRKISRSKDEVQKSKLQQSEVIVYGGFGIIFLLLVSGIIVQVFNSGGKFLLNLSATIIVAWVVMLICYYVWALYFYNINLGWSDDKWKRVREQQEDPTQEVAVPNKNPYSEETLGLPPGTVRGTIALTLLVGGLALTIGSFGMETSVRANQVLVDNFEFYKQAFIMMIAFYFGVKSLDALKAIDKTKPADAEEETDETKTNKDVKAEDLQTDFKVDGAEG